MRKDTSKKFILLVLMLTAFCLGAGLMTNEAEAKKKSLLVRVTANGKVKGKKKLKGRVLVWYGIPYGATTAGRNRWKAPQPVENWSGIKKTTKKKASAIQYVSKGKGYKGTQDCLYVNVFRPKNKKKSLPVLVYLHGGGNTGGDSNSDFSKMAKKMQVVIVSVSFRLGAFGFLSHPALKTGNSDEDSGNFTLLDIRAALRWVQNNIYAFGGNPGNVTLSGFSGGGRNVLMCLLSPLMKGLFHKAFIMSSGFTLSTPSDGQASSEDKLAEILVGRGEYDTLWAAKRYIKTLSVSQLKIYFKSLTLAEIAGMYKNAKLKTVDYPQGFLDGTVLPSEGLDVIKNGTYNRVPLMIGSDMTEFSSFGWRYGVKEFDSEWMIANGINALDDIIIKGIKYGSLLQSAYYIERNAFEIFKDSEHDYIYAFRTKWGTRKKVVGSSFYCNYVGAYHGQTKDFLIGEYKHRLSSYAPKAVSASNEKGRKALTRQMRKYLKNFMKSGNPNGRKLAPWYEWTDLEGAKKVMVFNANKKKVTSRMTKVMYDEQRIFNRMRKRLSGTEYKALTEVLFKDRFFMPEVTPEYRQSVK